jgi:hypothetical protein
MENASYSVQNNLSDFCFSFLSEHQLAETMFKPSRRGPLRLSMISSFCGFSSILAGTSFSGCSLCELGKIQSSGHETCCRSSFAVILHDHRPKVAHMELKPPTWASPFNHPPQMAQYPENCVYA